MSRRAIGLGCIAILVVWGAHGVSQGAAEAPSGWCLVERDARMAVLARMEEAGGTDRAAALDRVRQHLLVGESHVLCGDDVLAREAFRGVIDACRELMRTLDGGTMAPIIEPMVLAYCGLGDIELQHGLWVRAEADYRRATKIAQLALHITDAGSQRALTGRALCLAVTRPVDEQKELFDQILKSVRTAQGRHHILVACVYDQMAVGQLVVGDHREAEGYIRKALAVRKRVLRADHPELADTLNRLASVCLERGKTRFVGKYLRQALQIRLAAFGEGHPKVILARKNLVDFEATNH